MNTIHFFIICILLISIGPLFNYCHSYSVPMDVWIIGGSDLTKTHSVLISELKKIDYQLTVFDNLDTVPNLFNRQNLSVHNIILTSNNLPGKWTTPELVDFVTQGGNLIYAFGTTTPISDTLDKKSISLLLSQFGISIESKTPIFDPFQESPHDKSLLMTKQIGPAGKVIFEGVDWTDSPLLYKDAYGMKLDSKRQMFSLWNVLSPHWTASVISKTAASSDNRRFGDDLSIIASLQSTLNSRVTVISSSYLLTDASLKTSTKKFTTANLPAIISLIDWTFGSKGILKIQDFQYDSEKGTWMDTDTDSPKKVFRVLDNLYIQTCLSQWSNIKKEWMPFKSDDVQVEFIRMAPEIRRTLKPISHQCIEVPNKVKETWGCLNVNISKRIDSRSYQNYYAESPLANMNGLFTLRLHYLRPGWSLLNLEKLVVVRPYSHDEHPRLLKIAYPYYLAMISMICSIFFLTAVFVYFRESDKRTAAFKVKQN